MPAPGGKDFDLSMQAIPGQDQTVLVASASFSVDMPEILASIEQTWPGDRHMARRRVSLAIATGSWAGVAMPDGD